jgi:hypothetical protein
MPAQGASQYGKSKAQIERRMWRFDFSEFLNILL